MIYFVECETSPLVKIGFTGRDFEKRLSGLQNGCPFPLQYVDVIEGDKSDEAAIHDALQLFRRLGEWFDGAAAQAFLDDVKLTTLNAAIGKWAAHRDEYIARRGAYAAVRQRVTLSDLADELGTRYADVRRVPLEAFANLLATLTPKRRRDVTAQLIASAMFPPPAPPVRAAKEPA